MKAIFTEMGMKGDMDDARQRGSEPKEGGGLLRRLLHAAIMGLSGRGVAAGVPTQNAITEEGRESMEVDGSELLRYPRANPAGTFDAGAYLERIGYRGRLDTSAGTLAALHRAHLMAVPFENLDIMLGTPVLLDEGRLFEKIVRRRRGGIGYELNGLFALLLRHLGYDVTLISACMPQDGGGGAEFGHMALMVRSGDRWLVDVGSERPFSEPLLVDQTGEQPRGEDLYRIDTTGGRRTLRRRGSDMVWREQYHFTLIPRTMADFAPMCDYYQTGRDSHLNRGAICSRLTSDGWITLTEKSLTRHTTGGARQRPVAGREEFMKVLYDSFAIDPAATASRP